MNHWKQLDANNIQAAPLDIRFWSGEGSGKTSLTAYLTLKVESVVGSSVTTLYTYNSSGVVSSYSYTIPSDKYPTANRISIHAYGDAARSKEIDGKQVNIVVANPIPFPRPDAWSTGNIYKNGEFFLLDNVVYMWSSRVPGNTPTDPKTWIQNNPNSGLWTPYQEYALLATQVLLAKFALMGSAVFKDEFMFSQQGVDADGNPTSDYRGFGTADFTPNLLLDFLQGKIIANRAEINSTGESSGISISDGSFRILGYLLGNQSYMASFGVGMLRTGNPQIPYAISLQANLKGIPKIPGIIPLSNLEVGDLYVDADGFVKMKL